MFLKILKTSQIVGEKDKKYSTILSQKYGIARVIQFEHKIDCFYKDDLIESFLEKAYKLL